MFHRVKYKCTFRSYVLVKLFEVSTDFEKDGILQQRDLLIFLSSRFLLQLPPPPTSFPAMDDECQKDFMEIMLMVNVLQNRKKVMQYFIHEVLAV